jgi:hypothetical protein
MVHILWTGHSERRVAVSDHPGHSVKVPTTTEVAETDRKALDRIAWILATPEWSVGMLEDIARIVEKAGHEHEPHDEYSRH